MKLMKRTNTYKAANVTFDPTKIEAFSYGWWRFVAVVEGLVVFNNYSYSNTTSKHQAKVRSLMNELGIKIDLELPVKAGIKEQSLEQLIIEAEELLCDKFLTEKLRAQDRYEEKKAAKAALFNKQLDTCVAEVLENRGA